MKRIFNICLFSILLTFSGQSLAEERIQMKGTSIIGNRELPKMLYIVPWKASNLPDMDEPPLQRLVDDALRPIDRDEFRRQILLYELQSAPSK